MLNELELNKLMVTLKIPPSGQEIVRQIRASDPSRRVGGGAGNVACRYPSRKMKCIIQAESHGNELAAVYLWDHDSNTYEFYDQAPPIKLNYVDGDGKNRGHNTRPDFFLIQQDFIGWVECKTEEWLQKRQETGSTLFVKGESGLWNCPAGSDYASRYGLGFRIRSSKENSPTYVRNLLFLTDYWHESDSELTCKFGDGIFDRFFKERGWCRLSELLRSRDEIDADKIYTAIVQGKLFVNLYTDSLAEPEITKVFKSREIAEACDFYAQSVRPSLKFAEPEIFPVRMEPGEKLIWDGTNFAIKTVGTEFIYLENLQQEIISVHRDEFSKLAKQNKICGILAKSSETNSLAEAAVANAAPKDLELANKRYRFLAGADSESESARATVNPRTLRYWKLLQRQGQAAFGDGYVGLISRISNRGNTTRKIDEAVIEVMDDVIKNDLRGPDAKSKKYCFGMVRVKCVDKNLIPPSEKTFLKQIKLTSDEHDLTADREGAGVAYKSAPFIYTLYHSTARHGDRPFEIGHIDHTELDLQFVGSKFGELLKRPWLTVLLDAYSRVVLALVITFDPPSYRSNMLVIRECIKRHGRVPSIFVVDRGSDFDSTYFETLLAKLGSTKKSRPPRKPRFGSLIERFFGITNQELIHNLRGNNKPLQNPREMSSTHDPRARAVWTLAYFTPQFENFAYDVYGNMEHSTLGVSPNTAMEVGMAKTGFRAARLIPFTPELTLLCLPSTKKGTAKVIPSRGVKIGYLYYFHPIMRDPKHAYINAPVRYDPFNLSVAYAYLNGRWEPCKSELANIFEGRTEREITIIAGEINGKNKRSGERRAINAETLARFIMQLEGTEMKLLQKVHDEEHRNATQQFTCKYDATNNSIFDIEPETEDVNDGWEDVSAPSFGVFK